MINDKKSLHDNALASQSSMESALARAQDALKAQGINYPTYDCKLSGSENYDALEAYKAKEMKLVEEYLRPKPRPLEIDSVTPKKEWGSYYDR